MASANDTLSNFDRFKSLLRARHACIRLITTEEWEARELVQAAAIDCERQVRMWSSTAGVWDATFANANGVRDTEHPAAACVHVKQETITDDVVFVMLDVFRHLDDPGTLRALRELIHHFRMNGCTMILIDEHDNVPEIIRAESTPFELSLPDASVIEDLVKRTLRKHHREAPIDVKLRNRDLKTIVRNLQGLSRRHAEQIITDTVAVDRVFDIEDVNEVLARKRQLIQQRGALEYVEAPVSLDEIGGLRALKEWLRVREGAFSEDASEYGLQPPRGVLLLGVQGAGKSLSAKAIATAWGRPLLRLDPGSLYDRYVGESERMLRNTLRQAESMAPNVLWIDEIEKGFASAASRSNDGGLSQRMFGTLLTWMQEHEKPVFLVATANDIEALPPELLRKGRFDEIFFVDLPDSKVREKIFAIHLERRNQDLDHFDLAALGALSGGFSGAEIEQAVITALHEAFDARMPLKQAMIERALQSSPPISVTMREKIAALRAWAEDRCVPADRG